MYLKYLEETLATALSSVRVTGSLDAQAVAFVPLDQLRVILKRLEESCTAGGARGRHALLAPRTSTLLDWSPAEH